MVDFAAKSVTASNQIECKKVDCRLKGYWIETTTGGEKLYCHKVWHHGQQHTVKTSLKEIEMLIADS